MIIGGFWLAVSVIIYTFFGYPLLVIIAARWFSQPVDSASIEPVVTILIPAYNEATIIASKIENSLALDYPASRRQIVIVADGSNDETVTIANQYADQGISVLFEPERRGKITAVNRVMPLLTSEIVVFSDANAMLAPATLRAITAPFADPAVAAVAGEKRVSEGGEGLYWRYESYLKEKDSQLSSVMGAAGELFAIRRELYQPPEPDSILEDFIISLRLVAEGWRVVYVPQASAYEAATPSILADWERRTRIAAGGFQAIRRLPQLWQARHGRIVWQYVSHRVLRWAATPFLLPLTYLLNGLLWQRPFYRMLFIGQTLFYGLGLLGFLQARQGKKGGVFYTVFFFCFTNLAALAGFWRYFTGKQSVTWKKTR